MQHPTDRHPTAAAHSHSVGGDDHARAARDAATDDPATTGDGPADSAGPVGTSETTVSDRIDDAETHSEATDAGQSTGASPTAPHSTDGGQPAASSASTTSAWFDRVAHLNRRQRQILSEVDAVQRARGYPPSVRELCNAVGLKSPATVHRYLRRLEQDGWLARDESRPRSLIVSFDWATGTRGERRQPRFVPLVGDVAAGTDVLAQENVEELLPLPADFTGDGELFMLRVRGDSMIEAGILDRDYVVARHQSHAEPGDVVVAGIDGDEGTVKRFRPMGDTIVLEAANSAFDPIIRPVEEVTIFGKVVTVIRRMQH